jgi:transposase
VPLLPAPTQLSHAEKDALIAALTARLVTADERIAAQDARIAALEARLHELTRPPKTPDTSSKPPSQGQKQDRAAGADRPPRKAAPVSVARCIRIRIEPSTSG